MVNEVLPADEVLPRAEEFAAIIAANGPLAVRACKEAVIRTSGLTLAEAFEIEAELTARVMASDDAREGPLAFMEKRPPRFTGS